MSTLLLPLTREAREAGTGKASLAEGVLPELNAAQLAALPCCEPD